MALDSERYFALNSRIGLGGSLADTFDKFEQATSPRLHVGFKVEEADGTIYRYSHFGATVNRGVLCAQDKSESSVPDADNAIIAPGSATDARNGETPGTISTRVVQITKASVSAGDYIGAKFIITDDTGEGFTYDVVDNTATDDPASGDFHLFLRQKLQVALDATTDYAIVANKWHNLEIATAATDHILAGVSCKTIDAADNYGWVQSKGIVGILQDGTIADGDMITLSDGTSGAVQTAAGGGTDVADLVAESLVGYCADAGDTGGHGVFEINVD